MSLESSLMEYDVTVKPDAHSHADTCMSLVNALGLDNYAFTEHVMAATELAITLSSQTVSAYNEQRTSYFREVTSCQLTVEDVLIGIKVVGRPLTDIFEWSGVYKSNDDYSRYVYHFVSYISCSTILTMWNYVSTFL